MWRGRLKIKLRKWLGVENFKAAYKILLKEGPVVLVRKFIKWVKQ
jgi:hypothetical protein